MYIVFIRERCYFSQVCTFEKAIKNAKVKVVVQKWAVGFKEKIDNRCDSSIRFTFSSIVVIWQ